LWFCSSFLEFSINIKWSRIQQLHLLNLWNFYVNWKLWRTKVERRYRVIDCKSTYIFKYISINIKFDMIQVNLCQKLFFFAEHGENMLCTKIVLNVGNNFCTQHFLPRFELGTFMFWTCNLMNNLSSYCGLVDAKVRASDKGLPLIIIWKWGTGNLVTSGTWFLIQMD
jgi:hypothetical protein